MEKAKLTIFKVHKLLPRFLIKLGEFQLSNTRETCEVLLAFRVENPLQRDNGRSGCFQKVLSL